LTINGWIILDKPVGLGSTQAVGAVKRNMREAGYGKVKVGHGGTLDPLAHGVLPIALGEATKLCGRMLDASKEYAFTVRFGAETETLDLEGKVIAQSDVRPTLAQVEAVLACFTGPIEQVPPIYSALMVDGRRAYDLARAGEHVELKSRNVTVYALSILPVPGRSWKKSPSSLLCPRAPISAAWPATFRAPSARSGTSPCYAAHARGRSPKTRRFRWTNSTRSARARHLRTYSCRWRQGWSTSRLLTSVRNRQAWSDRAGFFPDWPFKTGFTGRDTGMFPSRWLSFQAVA
jgi:tRNA pseudouridine(55) synthase